MSLESKWITCGPGSVALASALARRFHLALPSQRSLRCRASYLDGGGIPSAELRRAPLGTVRTKR